jgi:ribosomal protein L37AE/L43A
MNKYRCKHCGRVVERDSVKMWITSFCEVVWDVVRITIVKEQQ